MDTQQAEKAEKAAGIVTGLLTGWGIPGSVARILAGAIIGAVLAWLAIAQTGCTASLSTTPDGSLQYRGSVGVSTVTK